MNHFRNSHVDPDWGAGAAGSAGFGIHFRNFGRARANFRKKSGISSGIHRGKGAVVAIQERGQKLAIGSDPKGFAASGSRAIERNQRQSAIQRNRRRSAIERNQWRSAIESDDEGEIYTMDESTSGVQVRNQSRLQLVAQYISMLGIRSLLPAFQYMISCNGRAGQEVPKTISQFRNVRNLFLRMELGQAYVSQFWKRHTLDSSGIGMHCRDSPLFPELHCIPFPQHSHGRAWSVWQPGLQASPLLRPSLVLVRHGRQWPGGHLRGGV